MFIGPSTVRAALLIGLLGIYCLYNEVPVWITIYMAVTCIVLAATFLVTNGNQAYSKVPEPTYSSVYDFKPQTKDQFTVMHLNWMQGIAFSNLMVILAEYWMYIDWVYFWPRVVALTLQSVLNSTLGLIEDIVYYPSYNEQKVRDDPIFILGHPRSGTTMLHNLLGEDKTNFIYPDTFQCGFPQGFLLLDRFRFLFRGTIDDTRPMDNMPLSFESPQEDEIALAGCSSGASPYLPLVFMHVEPQFRQYFSFDYESTLVPEKAKDPIEIFNEKKQRWKDSCLWFMKKVTFAKDRAAEKRMVLKSPVHTARGKILKEMFPKAQFIYIHREPYRVFQSAAHMAEKTYIYTYLKEPSKQRIQDFILEQYVVLFKEYIAAKEVIPKEDLIEISYADIEDDLLGNMKQIYEKFKLKGWNEMEAYYKQYAEDSKKFEKNSLVRLDPALKEVIYERWKEAFDYFGYEK